MQHKFYYRFEAVGIDVSDEQEIKKYNSELTSFDCLNERLRILKTAFDYATKERADIILDVLPEISGVIELQVYHSIRYKLFSRTVKRNCFSLCITKYNDIGQMGLYFYDTTDFNEVKQILTDFIEKKAIPDLSNWKCTWIG